MSVKYESRQESDRTTCNDGRGKDRHDFWLLTRPLFYILATRRFSGILHGFWFMYDGTGRIMHWDALALVDCTSPSPICTKHFSMSTLHFVCFRQCNTVFCNLAWYCQRKVSKVFPSFWIILRLTIPTTYMQHQRKPSLAACSQHLGLKSAQPRTIVCAR